MKEGVCRVKAENNPELLSTCLSHSDCNVGMFCADSPLMTSMAENQVAHPHFHTALNSKVCLHQRSLGETCTSDFDCANTLACANS